MMIWSNLKAYTVQNFLSKISIKNLCLFINLFIILYYWKSRKNTDSKNQKAVKTKNEKVMHSCKCKKSSFTKHQEASGLLNSLGIKKPFCKIPLVAPLLF